MCTRTGLRNRELFVGLRSARGCQGDVQEWLGDLHAYRLPCMRVASRSKPSAQLRMQRTRTPTLLHGRPPEDWVSTLGSVGRRERVVPVVAAGVEAVIFSGSTCTGIHCHRQHHSSDVHMIHSERLLNIPPTHLHVA